MNKETPNMLRLHHSPLACSLASRLALIEAGQEHEVAYVRTFKGEQLSEAYVRINPRGKVPALETSDGVIVESPAILTFIADLVPERELLPAVGTYARAVALGWLGYLSSTVHPAFAGVLFPERLAGDPAGIEGVRAAHLQMLGRALSAVDAHLEGRTFLLDQFSLCDLFLLVFTLWRSNPSLQGQLPVLGNLDAFHQRMLARPGVAAVIGEEINLRFAPA